MQSPMSPRATSAREQSKLYLINDVSPTVTTSDWSKKEETWASGLCSETGEGGRGGEGGGGGGINVCCAALGIKHRWSHCKDSWENKKQPRERVLFVAVSHCNFPPWRQTEFEHVPVVTQGLWGVWLIWVRTWKKKIKNSRKSRCSESTPLWWCLMS